MPSLCLMDEENCLIADMGLRCLCSVLSAVQASTVVMSKASVSSHPRCKLSQQACVVLSSNDGPLDFAFTAQPTMDLCSCWAPRAEPLEHLHQLAPPAQRMEAGQAPHGGLQARPSQPHGLPLR